MRLLTKTALLLAALVAASASAKTTDRQQAMDVSADHSNAVLSDDSDSTLSGHVKITQGSLEVNADLAVISRKGGEIREVTLTGAPATMHQVSDTGEPMTAHAAKIVYTLSDELIVLSGDVVIEQPRGSMSGQTIKYDLKTGRLDGGGDGQRVQMRILPKNTAGQ